MESSCIGIFVNIMYNFVFGIFLWADYIVRYARFSPGDIRRYWLLSRVTSHNHISLENYNFRKKITNIGDVRTFQFDNEPMHGNIKNELHNIG